MVYLNGRAPADPVLAHPHVRVRPLASSPARGLYWQEVLLPAAAEGDALDVFFSPAYTCPLSLDVPRVTAVHDLSFFSLPDDFAPVDGWRRRLLVELSLRASAAVLTISDFTAREIRGRFPEVADRLLHVPLGPDDDLPPSPSRSEARSRLGVRGPFLLSVGSILNRRRFRELVRAVGLLKARWPGLELDVVGDNRTHPRLDLEGIVASCGLTGRVRLSGFVTEAGLADRYAAADAAVFLSDYEGFGLPALEALSRGVPLVTSEKPATGEIFRGAALLVDPTDVPGIAHALEAVLSDSGLRWDLAALGRALSARYSWRATAERTRDALVSAAARG